MDQSTGDKFVSIEFSLLKSQIIVANPLVIKIFSPKHSNWYNSIRVWSLFIHCICHWFYSNGSRCCFTLLTYSIWWLSRWIRSPSCESGWSERQSSASSIYARAKLFFIIPREMVTTISNIQTSEMYYCNRKTIFEILYIYNPLSLYNGTRQ